jgi:hypothetical protein
MCSDEHEFSVLLSWKIEYEIVMRAPEVFELVFRHGAVLPELASDILSDGGVSSRRTIGVPFPNELLQVPKQAFPQFRWRSESHASALYVPAFV